MTTYQYVKPEDCPKFRELYDLISSFTPCQGRKAYFKAKITAKGVIFVSSQQLFVKKW
jgi:hypothetical protein